MDDLAAGQALLSINSAVVEFDRLTAVKSVSFSLHAGELLGLIGPNGAGKTTLLRAAAGLQALTRGSIRVMNALIGGDNGNGDREVLRHIGFTPDTPPMYEDLTVRHFLRFIAMGYGLMDNETDERIDFWLEKVWLAEKGDQKIKQLSRGMRQRVGIARTLLTNPAVILLDEPAAGLDPAGRAQFKQLLCDLREQGKALVISSHILADLEEYCTHIGIMSAGKMIQYGTVAEVSRGAHEDRCRYTVLLARPVQRILSIVAEIAGISDPREEGERLTLEYDAGRDMAAQLLLELMKLGIPIAAFSANAANIENAYLRTGIRQVD